MQKLVLCSSKLQVLKFFNEICSIKKTTDKLQFFMDLSTNTIPCFILSHS